MGGVVVVLLLVTGVKQSQLLDLSLGLEFDNNVVYVVLVMEDQVPSQ